MDEPKFEIVGEDEETESNGPVDPNVGKEMKVGTVVNLFDKKFRIKKIHKKDITLRYLPEGHLPPN